MGICVMGCDFGYWLVVGAVREPPLRILRSYRRAGFKPAPTVAPPLSPVSGYGAGPGRFPRERGKPSTRPPGFRLSPE